MPDTALTAPVSAAQFIVHFMNSIQEVLSTMAGMTVTVGKPALKTDPVPAYDVSGIIGFSGEFVGSMVLSFQRSAASAIVDAFAGTPIPTDAPDFADAVGELANMIAGSAKKSFGGGTAITVPSVILGSGHVLARLHDVPCVIIPCESAGGCFAVEVSIKAQRPHPERSN